MQIIDLSHVIADGTITYPGLPGPVISDHLSREASRERYAPGYEFQIGRIEMVVQHRDLPRHAVPPLRRRPRPRRPRPGPRGRRARACVVDATGGQEAGADLLDGLDVAGPGRAVPHRVGRALGHATATASRATRSVGASAAERLVEAGAAVVGIDSVNIDDTRTVSGRSTPSLLARRHPDRRAPLPPRPARPDGLPLLRRAAGRLRHGHVPGARPRRARLTAPRTHPAR